MAFGLALGTFSSEFLRPTSFFASVIPLCLSKRSKMLNRTRDTIFFPRGNVDQVVCGDTEFFSDTWEQQQQPKKKKK